MENIIEIQKVIMRQIKRLDDDDLMKKEGSTEISRSNAISNSSMAFIKAINLNLKISESKQKNLFIEKSLDDKKCFD